MKTSRLEGACWALTLVCCGLYGWARADAALNGARAIEQLESAASTGTVIDAPLGVLSIPSVALKAPLYADTRERYLNRGVGVIERTALPGEGGNLGIAGHRDRSFRALERLRIGDSVDILTPQRSYRYRIVAITIVDRSDAQLLATTAQPVVTLVTCHPFHFVGHAPRRFVARGVLISSRGRLV